MKGFKTFQKAVAGNIRRARTEAGLTQAQVARKGKFNARWYQDVEAGKSDLRISTVFRVARALGIEPYVLLKAEK